MTQLLPLLAQEGWPRDQANVAKPPCSQRGRGGPVRMTSPSAPNKWSLRSIFLRAQPSLLYQEGKQLQANLQFNRSGLDGVVEHFYPPELMMRIHSGSERSDSKL